MGRLENRIALITGAASGIGEATARLFAAEGARVALADMQDDRGRAVAKEITDGGGTAHYLHVDVSASEDVAGMVQETVDHFGGLDILYNNAGLARGGSIVDVAEDDWDLVINTDLKSIYLGCKYAIPRMRERGGAIISTASVAGLRGSPALHAYSAAKAGVINLTRSIASEVGQYNIRVNCVCPGIIETPIWGALGQLPPPQRAEMFRRMGEGVLLGRTGKPEDIARAVLFLASDDASYITGEALVVDGGLTAGRPPREGRVV